MSRGRTKTCRCRIAENGPSELHIGDSGFIGRQIIRLYRFMHHARQTPDGPARDAVGASGSPAGRIRHIIDRAGISRAVDFLYTYGIGGSLTRQDQLIFARYHAMPDRAYRLTLLNAVFFGMPSACAYFAAGEGFELLSRASTMIQAPSLAAAYTSFGIAVVNASIHVFRILDSLLHRRCWAPLGTIPLVINLPTYLKTAKRKISDRRTQPTDCDCP
jgi:hypothetical protein